MRKSNIRGMKGNTYWLSRQPKYNGAELFAKAECQLLEGYLLSAIILLRLAVAQSHLQATYLLQYLLDKNVEAGKPSSFDTVHRWIQWMFSNCDNPLIVGYHLYFSYLKSDQDFDLAQRLAGNDNAMAQFVLGRYYADKREHLTALSWYRRAVEHNFPQAFYAMGSCLQDLLTRSKDEVNFTKLIVQGAKLGDDSCRKLLVEMNKKGTYDLFTCGVSAIEILEFQTLLAVEHPWRRKDIASCLERNFDKTNLASIYAVGRTVCDSEETYPLKAHQNHHYNGIIDRAVVVYRHMTSRARQAAVQTILALRFNRLVCKDVAIMIAKLIYQSRSDVSWYANFA